LEPFFILNFPDETGLTQLSEVIIMQGITYLEVNIISSCFYKEQKSDRSIIGKKVVKLM